MVELGLDGIKLSQNQYNQEKYYITRSDCYENQFKSKI